MDTLDKIIFSVVPVVITIPVTVLLCRIRVAQKKQVAYDTMILGVFVVTFLWLVLASGGGCFSLDFWAALVSRVWTRSHENVVFLLKFTAFVAVICAIPALGVVHYYQKKSKRNQVPVT